MDSEVDAIFINGTVGAGKTTVAHAIGAIESSPHATVDLDGIRMFGPTSNEDPFNLELQLANLKSLSDNYRRAGAVRFVLAGVIEQAADIPRYLSAVGAHRLFMCRLTATDSVIRDRLARRHDGDPREFDWHVARAPQLARSLDERALDDLVLDSSNRSPAELAVAVRIAAGWS